MSLALVIPVLVVALGFDAYYVPSKYAKIGMTAPRGFLPLVPNEHLFDMLHATCEGGKTFRSTRLSI